MNFNYSGIFLFDIPSLLPDFSLKKIDKKIKFLGLVFNWKKEKEEKKIFNEARKEGFSCFEVENLKSVEVCVNLSYNLNQIGEFLYIFTNDFLLLQIVGPRTNIHLYKKNKIYDIKRIQEEFGVEPWKIPDLFSFLGYKEKNINPVMGIEKEKIIKWINYFASAEELINRLDLLEMIEDRNTFHYQNLIKKQEKKILENLGKLKLETSFLIPLKKELFAIRKRAKII